MMTMNGVPVPPEGLDYIKGLEQWLEQYPNDVLVRSKLSELQRDPRFAEPDEPDDIMPQVPELSEFPVPPGLKKYIDATRIIAGASVPTTAACVAATFNLLAAEDIDVQSRANAPAPIGPLLRRRLRERLEEELGLQRNHAGPRRSGRTGPRPLQRRRRHRRGRRGIQTKGIQPPGPATGLHHRSSLGEALEGPQDHGGGQLGRLVATGRLELPTGQPEPHPQPLREPLGRRPDLHRPAQPRGPRDLLLPAPPHRTDHGTGQCRRGPPVQPGRRQRVHSKVPAHH